MANNSNNSSSYLFRESQSSAMSNLSRISSMNTNNNNSNDNDVFSTSKQFHSKIDEKHIRKPSDRIQSKSRCALFCYNIPRSSLMITIPGFIILAIGAILIATTDPNASWTDGGMLLVSLIFLILGGVWTFCGLIYWLIAWIKYKPPLLPSSGHRQHISSNLSTYQPTFKTTNQFKSNTNNPPSNVSTTFESLNSSDLYDQQSFQQQQQQQQRQHQQQTQQQRLDPTKNSTNDVLQHQQLNTTEAIVTTNLQQNYQPSPSLQQINIPTQQFTSDKQQQQQGIYNEAFQPDSR